jgi:hypothetical protein
VNEIVCDSCGGQRSQLTSVSSELLKNMKFNFCGNCEIEGMEPRWLIVLAARQGRDVSRWLDNHLYHGDDIEPEHLN